MSLRGHIFNWKVWPDFTQIPDPELPFMRYASLELGESLTIKRRRFTTLPANHTVPAIGYSVTGESGATLVFTGDTTNNDSLWPVVNRIRNLRYLIIETAFLQPRARNWLKPQKHLCPSMLADELAKLERDPENLHYAPKNRAKSS